MRTLGLVMVSRSFIGARDLRFASPSIHIREGLWQHRRIGGVGAEFRERIENGSP